MNSLALCASVMNEAPYLDEWIAYHLLQGAERFYLNDDHSTDGTLKVLQPWIEKGLVELWSGFEQIEFFRFIAEEKQSETLWCAFFDLDEFYQGDKTLKEFLNELGNETVALELSWKHFGNSGLSEPDGRLVIERFVNHSPIDFFMNRFSKTVCRPSFVKAMATPHIFDYHSGKIVDSGKRDITAAEFRMLRTPTWENCWLNHYHVKTKPEYDKKFARGNAFPKNTRFLYKFSQFNRNEVFDDSMLKWAGLVMDKLCGNKQEN